MKRKKKALIISLSIIGGIALTYVGGGIAAGAIVTHALFSKRASLEGDEKSRLLYACEYSRSDFPNLSSRTDIDIPSNGHHLKGHLYEQLSPKGLFITAHGLTSLSDGPDAQYQNYLYELGYNVLSLDLTGSGESEGDGYGSMQQSKYDVQSAIEYVRSSSTLSSLDLYLCGHSWGAYGVVSSLEKVKDIKGVIAFAGYNLPNELMKESASEYMGDFFVKMTGWTFDISMRMSYGKEAFYPAFDAIKNSPNTNFLLIHGEEDETVPLSISIAKAAEKENNVKTLYRENVGHGNIWKSLEAIAYEKENVLPAYQELIKKYKREGNIPEEEKEAFLSNIDRAKNSSMSADVKLEILNFLNRSI